MQIIGGGKMGQALIAGLLQSKIIEPQKVIVVETNPNARAFVIDSWPEVQVVEVPVADEDCLLAVKPHLISPVCESLVNPRRVVSVAAGISTASIEKLIASNIPVIRAMPNIPALVGAGITAICGGTAASIEDKKWAFDILSSVGTVVEVEESQMDAVTGLSGSGPAYVFLLAEAMAKSGECIGLSSELSKDLAYQTLIGAAELLRVAGASAESLRSDVTTPNGTTAAGLAVLEGAKFGDVVVKAVTAASVRSQELGSK